MRFLLILLCISLALSLVSAAQVWVPSEPVSRTRNVIVDGQEYSVVYKVDESGVVVVPAVKGALPHFEAQIDVFRAEGKNLAYLGSMRGVYVEDGPCFEDDPGTLVRKFLPIWKVWYDDGEGVQVFHSSRDPWEAIPDRPGVQVVLVCESAEWKPGHPYRVVYRGADWYWFAGGAVHKSYGDGAPNGKWTPRPHPHARAGLTIPQQKFESYHQQAMRDTRCSVP